MSCKKECFEAILETCSDNVLLKAGLTPNTEYYWRIKDRHNNIYQRKSSTDGQGTLMIESEFMQETFNKYSGNLNLSIRLGSDYLQPILMTFGEEKYECVQLKFSEFDRDEDDTSEVNVITYKEAKEPI